MYVGFNQDYSCLAVATRHGFDVWNVNPFEIRIRRKLDHHIGIVRPLNRTNIFALVAATDDDKLWSRNSLVIWDDSKNDVLTNARFTKPIIGVEISMNMLIVIFADSINIYCLTESASTSASSDFLKEPNQFITYDNTPRTVAIGHGGDNPIAIFPAIQMGYVNISDRGLSTYRIIRAHESEIVAVAIHGTSLATASCKGTLIRVWHIETGVMEYEFRRGTNPTTICSLNFSADGRWLVACSRRGTAHIFDIRTKRITPTTNIETLMDMIPVWSFAQCRFPTTEANVVAGMERYNVYVATDDGDFYTFRMDPIHGGSAKLQMEKKLM